MPRTRVLNTLWLKTPMASEKRLLSLLAAGQLGATEGHSREEVKNRVETTGRRSGEQNGKQIEDRVGNRVGNLENILHKPVLNIPLHSPKELHPAPFERVGA